MKRFLWAVLLLFGLATAAAASSPDATRPLLWRVTGRHATVYLFGSVHALPPKTDWRDNRIARAIDSADAFYFEAPLDQGDIVSYLAENGTLPDGESLRAQLPPDSQADLDRDLAAVSLPEKQVDTLRPWFVTIMMVARKFAMDGNAASAGVDLSVLADARARGKPLRYFETAEQQMALLKPSDPNQEWKGFEQFLKVYLKEGGNIDPMVDAWLAGNEDKLAELVFKGSEQNPEERKAVFDDRNQNWVKDLKPVLDGEHGIFFVTVGAGHLISDRGVPALLRKDGYSVRKL